MELLQDFNCELRPHLGEVVARRQSLRLQELRLVRAKTSHNHKPVAHQQEPHPKKVGLNHVLKLLTLGLVLLGVLAAVMGGQNQRKLCDIVRIEPVGKPTPFYLSVVAVDQRSATAATEDHETIEDVVRHLGQSQADFVLDFGAQSYFFNSRYFH